MADEEGKISPVADAEQKPGSPEAVQDKPPSPQQAENPEAVQEKPPSPQKTGEDKPQSPVGSKPGSPELAQEQPASPTGKKSPADDDEGGEQKPSTPPVEGGDADRKSATPTQDRKSKSPTADDAGRKSQSPIADDAGRQTRSPVQKEATEDEKPEQEPEAVPATQDVNQNAGGETEEPEQVTEPQTEQGEEAGQEGQDGPETPADTAGQTDLDTIDTQQPEPELQPLETQPSMTDTTDQPGTGIPPSAASGLEKPQSPQQEAGETDISVIPEAPKLPSPERQDTGMEGTMSNTALNMVWSFGLDRNVSVLNLTDNTRKVIMYTCAHVGILYDFLNNRQHILQGHSNPITCTCVSPDKRWLATGDKGQDSMVIIWDTYSGIPIQTIFDVSDSKDGGVVAMAMTPDARYLATLSAAKKQVLALWDWTVDGETPICTAELKPEYGVQNFILFNPEDIHYLVTNSESQVIFFNWGNGSMQYFAPPLTDQDFNKAVGRYSRSIFQMNSSRALTATSIGNLVVWDNNKPITKAQIEEIYKHEVVSSEPSANKKALKIIRLQERGITVITTTDKFIVVADVAGHVKFFDQSLKLVHWYQDLHLGPISAVSFSHNPDFLGIARQGTNYPPDATIEAKQFVIRDFVVGSSLAVFGNVTADGTKVQVIHREHDAAIHALAAHPSLPYLVIGSYSGLLKIWDYEKKQVLVSRVFEKGNLIRCCAFDPKGAYLAVGFVNGTMRVLDSITLEDEVDEPFRYSRDAITHIDFSHDSTYLATADAEYAMTVYTRQHGMNVDPYAYLGRYRAHYKPIKDIMFGISLDSDTVRLMSLGQDRVLVEYDLEHSCKDELRLLSSDRIEQSAVPQCMTFYPPITKEHFLVTANDQFKFKLYNATTKMCRKTVIGPTYGSPIQKMAVVPTADPAEESRRYLAYITHDKVGLSIMPLDGNPHNAMALIGHPGRVSNLVCSHDSRYLFTAGGADASVHMWEINVNALEAQSKLGGEDLIPFYGLLEGGREGELFAELEDFFYYAQIRSGLNDDEASQGVNAMDTRHVSTTIPLTEVPYVMRAMGFYPSEQEIEDMLNEVKFSRYVETGHYVEDIDLGQFIKLYINHRPAFGLAPEKLIEAFDTLGVATDKGSAIDRGELLEILQSKGEHMTEYELAEYLTTLLGFNAEGGSSELQEFDTSTAGDIIDQNLPHQITGGLFSQEVLGFAMDGEHGFVN